MREVEVKIKVSQLSQFKEYCESAGFQFSSPVTQVDEVYVDRAHAKHFGVTDKLRTATFIRLRTSEHKNSITVKQRLSGELDCLERQWEVGTFNDTKELLDGLSFQKLVTVKKARRIAANNDFNVCLDEVEGLGQFIEVEKLCSQDINLDLVQKEIKGFIEKSNIEIESYVTEGYDTLLYKKYEKRN